MLEKSGGENGRFITAYNASKFTRTSSTVY